MMEGIRSQHFFPLLFLVFICTIGCKHTSKTSAASEAGTEQTASSDSPNFVTAEISGDDTEHFSAKGDAVRVGLLGSIRERTARFNISASNEGQGQTTELSTGFVIPFQIAVGRPQNAGGANMVFVRENSKTEYSEPTFRLFYDTEKEPHPIAHLTLSKADQLPSGNPMVVRYHLVGTFDYQAAYAPSPDTACAHEAINYVAAHGRRYPKFKADLCQAKKIAVTGTFDIKHDLPSSNFE